VLTQVGRLRSIKAIGKLLPINSTGFCPIIPRNQSVVNPARPLGSF